jgi:lipopolysaccharide export system protein LptA
MYFDADEGVLVYLKNVTVKDPRFELSGANELKIFLGKKTETKEDSKPKSDSPANKKRYGSVERIVATGAILIDQKAAEPGKEPIKASGALFTYNVKTEQIILSGGYPWITQGKTYMRAKEPNLVLRIFPKTGSFVTEGNWDMGGNLEQKR